MSAIRTVVMLLIYVGAVVLSAGGVMSQNPAGSEFRVNSYTTGAQRGARVATDGRGNFVVAWSGDGPTGSGVHGQRFDALGGPNLAEFLVAPGTNVGRASVAHLESGAFVVVWEGPDAQYNGIFARRYSRTGTALGAAFQVNTTTTGYQFLPSVAAAPGGGFLVVWSGQSQEDGPLAIVGRRFDAAGAGGGEFAVGALTATYETWPRAAFAPGGGFVVAWQGYRGAPERADVFLRRFDAAGAPVGAEFVANTYRIGQQVLPSLAFGRDGRLTVVWTGEEPTGGPDQWGIFGQRYNAAGAPAGGEFRAHADGQGMQVEGDVAVDRNGGFLVTWHETEGSQDVWGRDFDPSGAPRGLEFRINSYTSGVQQGAAVAADPSGNFVVAWNSGDYAVRGQDGDRFGVYAQRFGGLRPFTLEANAAGNGVLEPGEIAVIAPAWGNSSGATVSLTGTATSFSGPGTATYALIDGTANYGTIDDFWTASCTATGDCYMVSATGARPATHWDAVLEESAGTQHGHSWRVHLGTSFTDVPRESPYYRFVETVLHNGVSAGCAAGAYCPQAATTREQMTAMVLAAHEGASYRPPACGTPVFSDVPATSPFCPFVEEMARRGVVSGCGPGLFCAGQATTREQMAVFVLRTLEPWLQPLPCTTPLFDDVPASSPFCRWIEELAARGVVGGCGGGHYCPQAQVTREQMAVFLTTGFGLTLYGP